MVPAATLNEARARDADDPLAAFADEFHHPADAAGRRLVYLCGHSLGLQPKSAGHYVQRELEDWARLGVRGHHAAARPWIDYHEHFNATLAALVGAGTTEVVAMNSLTVNLHLMLVSFFAPGDGRDCILIEQSAFPSDRYAILSQLGWHGLEPALHLIEVGPRPGERHLRSEDLIATIERRGAEIALVLLPGVQYLTGQALDLAPVVACARRAGACVGLDLAHAIGNTLPRLHDWDVDFAVWCSYKYLNAGPGAIGGCFVHERHGAAWGGPRFAGWWGHDKAVRFLMEPDFKPLRGAEGWQLSNPPILSSAPLLASLEQFRRADLLRLRAKSLCLTAMLRSALEDSLDAAVEFLTPHQPEARGCQLSLRLRRPPAIARRCFDALTQAGIVADWREPDVLRLAPVPLYNSYEDTARAAAALAVAVREAS
jgi:kynureninase